MSTFINNQPVESKDLGPYYHDQSKTESVRASAGFVGGSMGGVEGRIGGPSLIFTAYGYESDYKFFTTGKAAKTPGKTEAYYEESYGHGLLSSKGSKVRRIIHGGEKKCESVRHSVLERTLKTCEGPTPRSYLGLVEQVQRATWMDGCSLPPLNAFLPFELVVPIPDSFSVWDLSMSSELSPIPNAEE
uniref:Uncharacterized protein n=1 Tax=Ditylenchus dipsaci TaxID=166011 RepID=A0A915CXH6_9BILA